MVGPFLPLLLSLVCVCTTNSASFGPDQGDGRDCMNTAASTADTFPPELMEEQRDASQSWNGNANRPDDLSQVVGDQGLTASEHY